MGHVGREDGCIAQCMGKGRLFAWHVLNTNQVRTSMGQPHDGWWKPP